MTDCTCIVHAETIHREVTPDGGRLHLRTTFVIDPECPIHAEGA